MSVSAGNCRVAVAEDNDEFGALWVVLSVRGGVVETVHRRYILNADPTDFGEVEAALQDSDGVDPRNAEAAGPVAAQRAADLFEVEQARMLEKQDAEG